MSKTFLTLVLISTLGLVVLLVIGTQSATSTVFLPSELAMLGENQGRERIRVVGRVTGENLDYQVEPEMKLSFDISDPAGGDKSIPVVYRGLRPDMFEKGRDVIIDGRFSSGVLQASQLMTQCPSKYEAPKPDELYKVE